MHHGDIAARRFMATDARCLACHDARRCGGGGPWSAALSRKMETATQALRSRRRPDVPDVDAKTETTAEEPFPAAR